jgi:trehalose-6-phosphate synthase
LPIGIDARGVHKIAQQSGTKQKAKAFKSGVHTLMVGVDRLDYTKGLLRKLKALEIFFERYPHRRGSVSLVQVAVPTRGEIDEYRALRAETEKAVGHINGLFAKPGWVPVTYICRSLPQAELVALYQAADIALVTPLRDGMNLVAKEYVASHKNTDGILILSELAGAAKDLSQALLVNPYDAFGMAEAIEQAFSMSQTERRQRMRALCKNVFTHDVHTWIQRFLKEAQKA